jgi:hypothetical protein
LSPFTSPSLPPPYSTSPPPQPPYSPLQILFISYSIFFFYFSSISPNFILLILPFSIPPPFPLSTSSSYFPLPFFRLYLLFLFAFSSPHTSYASFISVFLFPQFSFLLLPVSTSVGSGSGRVKILYQQYHPGTGHLSEGRYKWSLKSTRGLGTRNLPNPTNQPTNRESRREESCATPRVVRQ